VENLVYLNGEFLPESDAKISVYDHGLLYGDGIFEGIRAYSGRIFKLDRHIDRLYHSAKAIHMTVTVEPPEMARLILETARRNKLVNGYIRPIITRGAGDLGLDPRKCRKGPTIIIIARIFEPLYGEKYERGLKVVTSALRRTPPECVSPNIKSLNYLNNILARIEANQRGADEIILLDMNGFVSEASADNFFIVKGTRVIAPPTMTNLKGITRETALEIARSEGLTTEERFFTLFDVYNADEAFITGTAAEIAPVVEVDDRRIGEGKPGKITRTLMERYRILVNSTGTPIYDNPPVAAPAPKVSPSEIE
jgi:branched-chain amino acid aminotransferase